MLAHKGEVSDRWLSEFASMGRSCGLLVECPEIQAQIDALWEDSANSLVAREEEIRASLIIDRKHGIESTCFEFPRLSR